MNVVLVIFLVGFAILLLWFGIVWKTGFPEVEPDPDDDSDRDE